MATAIAARTCAGCETRFVPDNPAHRFCSTDCRKGVKPGDSGKDAKQETPEYTLTDASNHLLTSGPSVLSCGVLQSEDGPRLIVTVRTASTTLTVGLGRADAAAWLAELAKQVQEMQAEDKPAT